MTAIIIEDEKPAGRYLKQLIEKQNIKVDAVLHTIEDSINWFIQHPEPDLIFLDIQLSDGLSFEIFDEVQPRSAIIFTTAFDEYALRAFKLNSIDYLLKPINPKELEASIHKYIETKTPNIIDISQLRSLISQDFTKKYKERFLVKSGHNVLLIPCEEITCFYAKDKYNYLWHRGKEFLIDDTLTILADQLNPKYFFRINRGMLININYIEKIIPISGSRLQLKLKEYHETCYVSKEKVSEFKKWVA